MDFLENLRNYLGTNPIQVQVTFQTCPIFFSLQAYPAYLLYLLIFWT